MKGSVQYHASAKRYYISWYPERIWKNPITGEPFWHKKNAEKVLDKMRCEVDAGTFLLRSYMPDSPVGLKVVSESWLKAFTGTETTRKFYRKMIQYAIDYFGPDYDIRTFTFSKLQIYYNALNFTVRGKYHRLSSLKAMLNFAMKDGLIAKMPPFPALPQGLSDDIKSLSVINLFLSAQDGMLFPGGGYGAVPLMGSVRRVLEARGAVHSKAREGTSKAVPKKAWGWSQTHVGAIGV